MINFLMPFLFSYFPAPTGNGCADVNTLIQPFADYKKGILDSISFSKKLNDTYNCHETLYLQDSLHAENGLQAAMILEMKALSLKDDFQKLSPLNTALAIRYKLLANDSPVEHLNYVLYDLAQLAVTYRNMGEIPRFRKECLAILSLSEYYRNGLTDYDWQRTPEYFMAACWNDLAQKSTNPTVKADFMLEAGIWLEKLRTDFKGNQDAAEYYAVQIGLTSFAQIEAGQFEEALSAAQTGLKTAKKQTNKDHLKRAEGHARWFQGDSASATLVYEDCQDKDVILQDFRHFNELGLLGDKSMKASAIKLLTNMGFKNVEKILR